MILRRGLVSCLLIMGICVATKANEPTDSIRLNLDEALEIALSESPTVMVADNTITLKKYSRKETIAGLLPNISATGSLQHSIIQQKMKVDFSPEPIVFGQKNTIAANVNLNLPIISPQLWKTLQLNKQDIELSIESARSSKIEMVKSVKTAYFGLMLAKDALEALEAGYNNAKLNAKTVSDKFDQGVVSEYDKLVADVQLRNQVPQVANGKNAVRLATLQLKALMGIDINSPIIFDGALKDYEGEMFADLMEVQADTSIVNNSMLRQIEIQQEQLETSKKINRLGYAPTVGMSLGYGWQGMGQTIKINKGQWFEGSTLAVSVAIPIFDGGAKYFKNKQNKVSQINLALQKDNTERQLRLAVRNSIDQIGTAVEQVGSNKEGVDQAQKAFMISQKRYEIGSGTLLEMNSSETALTQARLMYAQSIYDYLSARTELESTLGNSVESTIENK